MAVWRFTIAIFLAALSVGAFARAEGPPLSDHVRTEHADTWLIPAQDGIAPGQTTWFAFSQKLDEGWHVYWRNPGDSGLPLDFNWSLPDGYEANGIDYPLPERIPIGPLANFGHKGAPVFLTSITAPTDAAPGDIVEITLTATWLICEEICVPEEGVFSLSLPVTGDPAANPKGAALVSAAKSELPSPWPGEARFEATANKIVLEADGAAGDFSSVHFFPFADGLVEPAAPQQPRRKEGALSIVMTPGYALAGDASKAALLDDLSGVLVFEDEAGARRGFEVTPQRAAGLVGTAPAQERQGALFPLLAFAFLGGVLLNLMPCVFPVVFIKAAALIETARERPANLRREGLLYLAGVTATFAALGAALLLARAGGEQLGWGFQLQSPAVVLFSAYVLFLVGLNLAGVFHVGESLQTVGSTVSAKSGGLGAFLTGVLAVFVAAPCIGPLMSAPLAAAVLLPPAEGMAIFIAMAAGLAAPYVAVSFSPALGRLLPHPGGWMVILKQALAFPVFGAAAFFVWVLAQQAGPQGLARALAGAVVLALAAWLFQLGKGEGRGALAARIASGLALLIALAPMLSLRPVVGDTAKAPAYGALSGEPYEEDALAALRLAGKPVFVDFTAAWCVTCQFNKMTILSKRKIADAFAEQGAVLMIADWTNRDPAITEALQGFGAAGVPLYVYFPPEGDPQVLPLPLTEGAVLDAIQGR